MDFPWIILLAIPFLILSAIFIYKAQGLASKQEKNKYALNPTFLSSREASFFNVLLPISSKHNLHVFAKPRIADFVNVTIDKKTDRSEFYKCFNKISQKHIDFLLCDINFKPIIGFEVDDKTHKKSDRVARDSFVDGMYKSIGFPVHHIWSWNETETIEQFIINANENIELNDKGVHVNE